MSRLLGPDDSRRLVYSYSGGYLRTAEGASAVIYTDATGSTRASIAAYDGTTTPGAVISNATLIVDSYSLLPRFWFPDGLVATVYVSVNGGPLLPLSADFGGELDGLSATVDGLSATVAGLGATTSGLEGVFNVKDYGAVGDGVTDDRAAILAAFAAAEAAGGNRIVYLPPGNTFALGATLHPSGYSSVLRGGGSNYAAGGPRGSVLKALTGQTGPVLDLTGWAFPSSARGRAVFSGFAVQGDGTADASKAKTGIYISNGNGIALEDISISGTGGPALDLSAVLLSDFSRIVCGTPVGAKLNDVPYIRAKSQTNGNRFVGIGVRSMSSSADCGASGAIVFAADATFSPDANEFVSCWVEFLHPPSGGTILSLGGNSNTVTDFAFWDCSKESGATGTSFIRLNPTGLGTNSGGNLVRGVIPGKDTSATAIDTGVDVRQNGNRIEGVKGYRGYNVTLASGVAGTTVNLGGAVSGATDPAVQDNSGVTTNTIIDTYLGDIRYGAPTGRKTTLTLDGLNIGQAVPRTLGVAPWWYTPAPVAKTTLALAVNTLYAVPLSVGAAASIDRMACETTVAAGAGGVLRYGIYLDDGSGRPGALLFEAPTVDATAAAGVLSATITQSLSSGLVWLACVGQVSACTVRSSTASVYPVAYNSSTLDPGGFDLAGYRQLSVSGALPATFTVGAVATNVPRLYVRRV